MAGNSLLARYLGTKLARYPGTKLARYLDAKRSVHVLAKCSPPHHLCRPKSRQSLQQVHETNGWRAPETGCLDVLANHGFLDCLHAVRARQARQTASPPHTAPDSHGSAPYFTTPAVEPRVRVDYCFVRGEGVQVDQVRVLENVLSDHRALVVDLSFPRQSPQSGPL